MGGAFAPSYPRSWPSVISRSRPSSIAKVATAQADTEFAAESLGSEYEVLARLLLRSEGVASSFIEGITAPVIDIVLAERDLPSSNSQATVGLRQPRRGDISSAKPRQLGLVERDTQVVARNAHGGQPDA